jgi:hypothetical protein
MPPSSDVSVLVVASPFAILVILAFTCWCWLGRGPWCLRWIALIALVLLSSGHPLGAQLGLLFDRYAVVLVPLFLVFLGLRIMLGGLFRRHHAHLPRGYSDRERRWHGHRW